MTDSPNKCCPFCGANSAFPLVLDPPVNHWGTITCGNCRAKCGDVRIDDREPDEWHGRAWAEWNTRGTVT